MGSFGTLRALSAGVAALGLLVATACVTPAVPVPPPEPENMTFAVDAGAGVASFEFGPEPSYSNAIVFVFNESQGTGVIDTARADGSVAPTAPFPAAIGDRIVITFQLEAESASTCVELRDGPSSSALECVL